ncbi:NAD(P)-binding protein [Periconia macrospinosa]|uniref:NAD(P)-binding protein n=1 Tax=Periconia macrospinosa TaxID=97972 RepID=A0A2V1E293_9PLEO|nr:NAD(P)-binding protein [Periconia macrospinosa]
MSSPRLITVYGATGAQGNSVIRSLQQNKTSSFTLRATTRNLSSIAAQELAAAGFEIVQADGLDKASLVAAFKDSWGVFVNTDSSAASDGKGGSREVEIGWNLVDAAVEAGVEVFVYSGLKSAKRITGGKVEVEFFEQKTAIFEYALSKRPQFKSVVSVVAGWYIENFANERFRDLIGGFPSQVDTSPEVKEKYGENMLVLHVPKWGGREDVPFIDITNDYGDIVHAVFLEPSVWDGKSIQAVSDIRSWSDAVEAFQKVTHKNAIYQELPLDEFQTYGVWALEMFKRMFEFFQVSGGEYYGERTENGTAKGLKEKAWRARGNKEVGKLGTLEEYFGQHFRG